MQHREWSQKLAGQVDTQRDELERLKKRSEELLQPILRPSPDRRKTDVPVTNDRRKSSR